jgi:hypothetical protein
VSRRRSPPRMPRCPSIPPPPCSRSSSPSAAYRPACRQARVFQRLVLLSLGLVVCLGRQTLSQVLVSLGTGQTDWSAGYRLFRTPRLQVAVLQRILLQQVLADVADGGQRHPVACPPDRGAAAAHERPDRLSLAPGTGEPPVGAAPGPRRPGRRAATERDEHLAQRVAARGPAQGQATPDQALPGPRLAPGGRAGRAPGRGRGDDGGTWGTAPGWGAAG